jgi:hypothetical protein
MDELLNRARGGDKSAENGLFQRLLVRFRLFARQGTGQRGRATARPPCIPPRLIQTGNVLERSMSSYFIPEDIFGIP